MPHSAVADGAARPGAAVQDVLVRIVRRTRARHVLFSTSAFMIVLAIARAAGFAASGVAAGVVSAAAVLWRGRNERTAYAAAIRVDHAADARNVVVTAEELVRHPDRTAAWVRKRVLNDADAAVRVAAVDAVAPVLRPAVLFAVSLALLTITWGGMGQRTSQVVRTAVSAVKDAGTVAASTPLQIVVSVMPPPYLGLPAREVRDPERIEAIEGSVVRITISGGIDGWRVRTAAGPLATSNAGGQILGETRAAESGYFAVEPVSGAGGERRQARVIPLIVLRDLPPNVRLTVPGRDLVLPDATRSLNVEAAATDDYGLAALEIRYTKVSGSGEQFEFEEGTLPVSLARDSGVLWRAGGNIPLASLQLEAGDALVYRAVARDGRPGDAGLASSDTFFVEIAGPGQVALEGFEMPPDQERYALSQQMIVLKIQRLRARERQMTAAAIRDAAQAIAAEQRAVRANFIFLMGGHVEDEEVEAEQSSDIQEGRLQNTARQEINAAVGHMTRAEQALVAPDTASALAAARAAVEALQRAFGRNRYILRTIAVGTRVDPSRRLTGELSQAGDWRRDPDTPTVDRETLAARTLLVGLLDTASAIGAGRKIDAAVFTSLAEQALAIDAADAVWQEVARRLQQAATAPTEGSSVRLGEAIAPVIARARRGARMPAHSATQAPSRLRGAWALEAGR
jgi:hypothetical protein